LQDVIAAARPILSDAESRQVEKLITEYEDIFAMKNDDYGWTDNEYHRRHRRVLTDSPNPKEAPPNKTGRNRRDARGHAATWRYRRVR
jgi:hypothetical protein